MNFKLLINKKLLPVFSFVLLLWAGSPAVAVDEMIPHPIDERGLMSDIAINTTRLFRPVEIIEIRNGELQKRELTTAAGTVVVIDNRDKTNHRLLFPPAPRNGMVLELTSTVIREGEKWGAQFLEPGEYPFSCTLHPEKEHGVIKVLNDNDD